jgi:hypothetical protein
MARVWRTWPPHHTAQRARAPGDDGDHPGCSAHACVRACVRACVHACNRAAPDGPGAACEHHRTRRADGRAPAGRRRYVNMATKEMIANYMDGKRGLDAASEQADLAGDRRRHCAALAWHWAALAWHWAALAWHWAALAWHWAALAWHWADLAGDRRRRTQIDPCARAHARTHARTHAHAACRRHALRRASLRVRQRDDARGGRARLRARDALGGGDGLGGRVHHARGVADRARARVGLRRDRAGRGTQRGTQRALNGKIGPVGARLADNATMRLLPIRLRTHAHTHTRMHAHTHTRMRACAYTRWQRRRRDAPCAAMGSAAAVQKCIGRRGAQRAAAAARISQRCADCGDAARSCRCNARWRIRSSTRRSARRRRRRAYAPTTPACAGGSASALHSTAQHAARTIARYPTQHGGSRGVPCRAGCVQVAEVEGGAAAWALDGRVLVDDVAVQARHSSGRCDDRFGSSRRCPVRLMHGGVAADARSALPVRERRVGVGERCAGT